MDRRAFLESMLATAAVPLAGAPPRPDAGALLLVGTYTDKTGSAGVYRFRMNPGTGALAALGASDAGPNPSFLAVHPRRPVVYAVNELEQYGGAASGALSVFALDRDSGALKLLARRATAGGAPCYVSVDPAGREVMVANYSGGDVVFFHLRPDGTLTDRIETDQHEGTGPRADRQEKAHAHSIVPDPSGRWAVSADLGADRIYVYPLGRAGAAESRPVAVRPGTGPRHLAFDRSGRVLYAVGELDLTLSAYRFDPATGALTPLQTVALVEGAPGGERTAADVHLAPSGRFLYASVRGDDVIAVFAVDRATGALTLVERVPTGGHWPRNFGLDPSGRFLLVANQRSNSLVGFRVDERSGRLTPSGVRVEVPAPVCVRFVG